LTILKSKKNTFPPSTVVIEQYRPPIDKYVVGELLNLSRHWFWADDLPA
jgi:hypothetical protein